RPRNPSRTCARAYHIRAVADRGLDRVDHDRAFEYVEPAGGAPIGLRIRLARRPDEPKPRQAHRIHRPRRAADITGMTRFDEYNAHVIEGCRHRAIITAASWRAFRGAGLLP